MSVRRTWKAEAGAYDTRVTIQRRGETQTTEMNEPIAAWSTYCTRWASLHGATGREFTAGDQTTADVGYMVRMRADGKTREIVPKMRLLHRGRTFEIMSVVDIENRHIEMLLGCREVV